MFWSAYNSSIFKYKFKWIKRYLVCAVEMQNAESKCQDIWHSEIKDLWTKPCICRSLENLPVGSLLYLFFRSKSLSHERSPTGSAGVRHEETHIVKWQLMHYHTHLSALHDRLLQFTAIGRPVYATWIVGSPIIMSFISTVPVHILPRRAKTECRHEVWGVGILKTKCKFRVSRYVVSRVFPYRSVLV